MAFMVKKTFTTGGVKRYPGDTMTEEDFHVYPNRLVANGYLHDDQAHERLKSKRAREVANAEEAQGGKAAVVARELHIDEETQWPDGRPTDVSEVRTATEPEDGALIYPDPATEHNAYLAGTDALPEGAVDPRPAAEASMAETQAETPLSQEQADTIREQAAQVKADEKAAKERAAAEKKAAAEAAKAEKK